jgi:hypothetical protein
MAQKVRVILSIFNFHISLIAINGQRARCSIWPSLLTDSASFPIHGLNLVTLGQTSSDSRALSVS